MRRRPTPLTDAQRQNLVDCLGKIITELKAPNAGNTQRFLADAADNLYASRASTVPPSGGNRTDEDGVPLQPDTPTERLALERDRTVEAMHRLMQDQIAFHELAFRILEGLKGVAPNRRYQVCPRCNSPFPRNSTRCDQIVDGRRCEASNQDRTCKNCGVPVLPGRMRKDRCPSCAKYFNTHGRDRIATTSRLTLEETVIIDGVAHEG